MRVLLVAIMLCSAASPSSIYAQKGEPQEHQKSSSPSSNPGSSINVTASQPRSEPQKDGTKGQSQDRYEWFWPPMWSDWALVIVAAITAHYAIRNLRAIEAQVDEMRKTGAQTDALIRENIAQSRAMIASVEQATRSAAAMEGVAESLKTTATASLQSTETSRQMLKNLNQQFRAWITVLVGGGAPQDRSIDRRFAATFVFRNAGLTPAKSVRYRITAAILPAPIASDFDFPLPQDEYVIGSGIATHQDAPIASSVDSFAPDEEVDSIKTGKGAHAVYVWGVVIYDDVLGGPPHHSKFCQKLIWPDGENVVGIDVPAHSSSD